MRAKKTRLKEKADKIFSQYIRLRVADERGFVECYTCGKRAYWKDGMQNGHFFKRDKLGTRYHEKNCNVQCVGCNIFKQGNYPMYAMKLFEDLSQDEINELKEKAFEKVKDSLKLYENVIETYQPKVNKLDNSKIWENI